MSPPLHTWDEGTVKTIKQLAEREGGEGFRQDYGYVITVAKINELMFEYLLRVLYSEDLVPYDYFLFPNLKQWLNGKRLANNEEVASVLDNYSYLEELGAPQCKQGIETIEYRWEKCIKLNGDYVEK